ncbi:MAG: hypothetical protein EOO73_09620 [Myxococcales bacterium]|nr:MAG: hypothetical protein EOO73_09620 [Myxococcales bacterium]
MKWRGAGVRLADVNMPPLSREAIFGVLSGLTLLACDKSPTATAEPATPAAAAAPSGAVTAKEVPSAASSGEKPQSCAPGGCAPGKCGGNEKK